MMAAISPRMIFRLRFRKIRFESLVKLAVGIDEILKAEAVIEREVGVELTGGDQHSNPAVVQAVQNSLPLVDSQISGENFSRQSMFVL